MNYEPYPTISPADRIIYVNATSLKKMSCPRAFQFHNTRGYKLAKEDEILTVGRAMHKYAEEYTRRAGKHVEALAVTSEAFPGLDTKNLMNWAAGRSRINIPPALTLDNTKLAVEFFFSVAWRRYFVDGNPIVLVLCGTIDHLAMDERDTLWIIDYKSSRRWKLDEISADYARDMQFRFYMWNCVRHGASFLPLRAFNAATAGHIAAQVVGIQVGSSKTLYWHKCPPIMMNDDDLAEFDGLMDATALEILSISTTPDIAPAVGKIVGACKYCDFGPLCYARSELESDNAARLFVQKNYDPQHHND
jgi:hypothetical protein